VLKDQQEVNGKKIINKNISVHCDKNGSLIVNYRVIIELIALLGLLLVEYIYGTMYM
jgi:hypothetical protein